MYRKILSVAVLFVIALNSCATKQNTVKEIPKIIFETDMGNDIDDALALDMIYKYVEQGKLELLAIMTNRDSRYSAEFIDIMGSWYGHSVPIGVVRDGANTETGSMKYDQAVCELKVDGKPVFARSLENHDSLIDAHILYRKLLAEQPDNSVTVISVGFSTNLARLLETQPDEYSALNGKELVAKKVKLLSVMAGSFGENKRAEYNVVKDIESAQRVYAQWQSPIATSPFEVGAKIHYPGESIAKDFGWVEWHPMVEAYKAYREMPYNRPTWDLTSVLYVAEPDSTFMTISPFGKITIDGEGYSIFEEDPQGEHFCFSVDKEQIKKTKSYFIELITQKPARYRSEL